MINRRRLPTTVGFLVVGGIVLLACGTPADAAACPCKEDLTQDGAVDGADLGLFLAHWGPCANCPPANGCVGDFNGDCNVDGADLGILLGNWGPCEGLPPNDDCADAIVLGGLSGSFNKFCTLGATTDGPSTGTCYAPDGSIQSDVWYRFIAPIDGTAQVGLCADFDVRAAVYGEGILVGGCSCPGTLTGGPLLACGEPVDFPVPCENAIAMLVPITAGKCYTIRVGGAPGEQGKGSLDINLYYPPCEVASNTKLSSSGIDTSDEYGLNVDISGDSAIIGAIFDDYSGLTFAGSARVFVRNGIQWSQQAMLTPPSPFSFQRFGISSAISGDFAAVGAGDLSVDCQNDPNCDTGEVFVFQRNRGAWTFDDSVTPIGGSPKDQFGGRVDLDGTRLVVGATDDDNANGTRSGAAYIFERIFFFGNFLWLQTAKLIASDGDNFDGLGSDVGLSGSWAIVGADNDENGGSAYLYNNLSGPWMQAAKLAAPAPASSYGQTVAIDGDFAVVGAPGTNSNEGRAYLYRNIGGTWTLINTFKAHDATAGAFFGSSVSINGKYMLIGARSDNGVGAAYLYWHVNGGWLERAKLVAVGGSLGDSFNTVAAGDGFGLVGAYLDDTLGGIDAGSVCAFNALSECNGNGVVDACDINSGSSLDLNGDAVPDECQP